MRPAAAIPASSSAISRLLGADVPQFWARRTATGFLERNHGLTARYGAGGIQIAVGGGTVAMHLTGAAPSGLRAQANRVTYAHDGGLSEWYANGPLGLEQGLRIGAGSGGSTLTFRYALSGSLTPRLNGGAVNFTAPGASSSLLSYRGLSASDAVGRTLPSRLSLAGNLLTITVDASGARYPINVDPTIQSASLSGSDSVAGDQFGYSIAQNEAGTVVLIGAPSAKIGGVVKGAVYVFVEPKAGWANATQNLKLTAPDGAAYDRFGQAVGIVGSTVVVGAPGHAVGGNLAAGALYAWTPGSSTPVELIANPGAANVDLGSSIAVAGPQLFAGAPGYNGGHGAVFEYTQPPTGWTTTTGQTGILTPSDTTASFGTAVAASGVTVAVGSPFNSVGTTSYVGAAYVFNEPSTGWHNMTQTAKLTASDGAQYDQFGSSVAIYANTGTIAVGSPGGSGGKGATYVFQEPAAGWQDATQTAEMTQSSATTTTRIGHTVAITNPAGTGAPVAPVARDAQTGPPSPVGWHIAVVGGSSNGTGLVVWSASNGTWANQSTGTPVVVPVLGASASPYSVDVGTGLLAISSQTTIGNVIVIPTATSTTTGPCTGPNCCTGASTICCAAKDGGVSPLDVHPDLNNFNCDNRGFYYYSQTTLNTVKQGAGAVIFVAGGAVAIAGALGKFVNPWAGIAATIGGPIVAGWGGSMYKSAADAQHDPPDPNFQSLAVVPPIKRTKVRAGRGLSHGAANALGKYLTDLNQTGAVATTLATTINRSGGAIAASNTAWEGKQIRYAIGLVATFNAQATTALRDANALNKAAKHSPALNVRISPSLLRAIQRQVRKHGIPARAAKSLSKLGVNLTTLKAELAGKLPKGLPKTLLQFLAGTPLTRELTQAITAFTDWSKTGQIVAESHLT